MLDEYNNKIPVMAFNYYRCQSGFSLKGPNNIKHTEKALIWCAVKPKKFSPPKIPRVGIRSILNNIYSSEVLELP